MTRVVQAFVSLWLLIVLSGAPVVAVLCAEWCLDVAHQGHATSSQPAEPDCHGDEHPQGRVLSAAPDAPCGDHGEALAGPTALAPGGRVDAISSAGGAVSSPWLHAPPAPAHILAAAALPAPAPRSASSHSVLRI